LFDTEEIEQLSNVIGVPRTTPVAVHALFADTEIAVGAMIDGLAMSTTVTTCVAVAVRPAPSVTVHVTVVFPKGNTLGALFATEATVQLSAVTGVPNATLNAAQALFAFTVTLAGAVMVGFVLSTTVTVCVAVAVRPEPSITVQVIVVVPNEKVEGALFVTLATEQLSAVTGVPNAKPVTAHEAVAFIVIFAGAVMVGFTLSITVITCVAVDVFPEPSVTVQVTVVFPNGKATGALFDTEAILQLSFVKGFPKTTPVAVQAVFV
jgi:hypothetical protein